jgi:hypothetical protein
MSVDPEARDLRRVARRAHAQPGDDPRIFLRKLGISSLRVALTMAEWKPVEASKLGEWSAYHEIILCRTPDERATRPGRAATR